MLSEILLKKFLFKNRNTMKITMKILIYLITVCVFLSGEIVSQINHATIEKVAIAYRPYIKACETPTVSAIKISTNTVNNPPNIGYSPPATGAVDSTSLFSVVSEAIITLKNTILIKKVFVKIFTQNSNDLLYSVSYDINDSEQKNSKGIKMFYREGAEVHICNPAIVSLKPHTYEIITEDITGFKSPAYTITK